MRSIRYSFIKSDGSDCKGNPNQTNTTMPASFATPAFTNPKISTTTNRITTSGYSYDLCGFTRTDADGRSNTYDGENMQTQVRNSSNVTLGRYSYDGGVGSEGRCIQIGIKKAAGLTRRLLHLEILADPQDIEECLRSIKIVTIYW